MAIRFDSQVNYPGLPGVSQNLQPGPNVGAGIAQAVGQATQQVGDEVTKAMYRVRESAWNARMNRAQGILKQRKLDLMENRVLQMKGQEPLAKRGELLVEFSKISGELKKELPAELQKDFEALQRAETTDFMGQLDRHANKEMAQYRVDQVNSIVELSGIEAVNAMNDGQPELAQEKAEAARKSVEDFGKANGWSPERIKLESTKVNSRVLGGVVESMIENENPQAEFFLAEHKKEMLPQDVAKLTPKAEKVTVRAEARGIHDILVQTIGNSEQIVNQPHEHTAKMLTYAEAIDQATLGKFTLPTGEEIEVTPEVQDLIVGQLNEDMKAERAAQDPIDTNFIARLVDGPALGFTKNGGQLRRDSNEYIDLSEPGKQHVEALYRSYLSSLEVRARRAQSDRFPERYWLSKLTARGLTGGAATNLVLDPEFTELMGDSSMEAETIRNILTGRILQMRLDLDDKNGVTLSEFEAIALSKAKNRRLSASSQKKALSVMKELRWDKLASEPGRANGRRLDATEVEKLLDQAIVSDPSIIGPDHRVATIDEIQEEPKMMRVRSPDGEEGEMLDVPENRAFVTENGGEILP